MWAAIASAQEQYPVMNMVAGKVIQKYQEATCEQLWVKKGQQKSQQEEEIVQLLRADPQMRQAFLDKVAGPIVNKMFECGMIP
jgi:isopentenyl diphosphate isomerase/L-lactate dehydrogenase-like FMN-dependent dehydrogenase